MSSGSASRWGGDSRFGAIRWAGAMAAPPPPAPPSLEVALEAALLASPAIAALVAARIYPLAIPETAAAGGPALAYRIAAARRVEHLRGGAGLVRFDVEFDVQGARHRDLYAVREAVRSLVQGLPGIVGGLLLMYVSLDGEADSYAPPPAGSDLGTHRKSFTFRFTIRESLPTHSG